ncbi:30S ribosomal protein S12 methylthiotransferase RimO [Thermodesulfobacteriota bacterium]
MIFHVASLGCARNLVDSESMTGRLLAAGHETTEDPAEAEVIVINTCSFIEAAINESIDTILALARHKTQGDCGRLIVTGCLPERFREEIVSSLPEVDMFLGTGAYDRIVEAVMEQDNRPRCLLPDPDALESTSEILPRAGKSLPMSYLKIAEGCDRHCTYCIIPKLRGRQKSRPIRKIVQEAATLVQSGVKELVLVAQETSAYGTDIGLSNGLSRLLQELSAISSDIWIRMLYGHPESMDDPLIRTMHEADNICSYFDIPIQHASNRILKKMGRQYQKEDLFRLFDRIRSIAGDACLRTTVITGFPEETESDFDELFNCIEEIQFDHLGVFNYSDSEDLASHGLGHHVPEDIAMKRYEAIMSRQMDLSAENNEKYLHRILPVLIEEMHEKGLYIGRTVFQAPEVDGITYVHGDGLAIGGFADVRITDTLEYDVTGEVL